jgi:hypothetical protein
MAAPSASGKETRVRRRILEAAAEVVQTQEHCCDTLVQAICDKAAQPKNTALYVKFWDLYVLVGRLARSYPDAFRILRARFPEEPGRYPYVWEFRKRLARTSGELISQGMAGGDLRPSLDREVVADRFLLFCLGVDEDPNAGPRLETLARFDLFWRGIAHPRSPRCRPTPWGNLPGRLA